MRKLLVAVALVLAVAPAHAREVPPCLDAHARADAHANAPWTPFRRNTVALPPLLYVSADRAFAEVALLYWQLRDVDAGTTLRALVPFLVETCAPGVRTWYTLLGGARADRDGLAGLVGPYFFRRDAHATSDVLFPLFARLVEPDSTTFQVGPFYRHRDARTYKDVLWPLYFDGGDRTTGEHTSVALAPPMWLHRGGSRAGWDAGVLPLWLGGRHGASRYDVVPALALASWADARQSTLVAGPFYRRVHKGGGWSAGLLPVYAGARDGDRYLDALMLTWWRWGKRPDHYFFGLLPPTYYHANDDGSWSFALVPFYAGARDAQHLFDLVPPLLFARWRDGESSYLWLANWYGVHHSDGRYSHTLLPLYHDEGTRDARTSMLLLPPSWLHVAPGTWDAGVLPLWLGGRGPGGAHYDVVPSLATAFWGDARTRTMMVGPLYGRLHLDRPGSYDVGLMPLLSVGRHGASTYDAVPAALFATWSDGDERGVWFANYGRVQRRDGSYRDVVFPLYVDRGRRGAFTALSLAPLAWLRTDAHETSFGLPPLVAAGHDDESAWAYTPFAWYRRDGSGWDVGAAPLFATGRHGRDGAHYTLVLPPLVVHAGDRSHEATLVGQTWVRTGPDGWDAGSFPFYVGGRRRDRHYYDAVLPPIAMRWGSPTERTTMLTPLVVDHEDFATRRRETVVFPVWWRFSSPERDVDVAFPLAWDFHDKAAGTRLSILAPVGFRWQGRDEDTTMVLNTLWTRGKGEHAGAWSFHLFPLVDVARFNPDHLRWQVLLGLLGREREGDRSRWRLAYVWTNPS